MPVQTLSSPDLSQFFNRRSPSETGGYRLDTRVSAVTVSTDVSGRFSVTTAEGDRITLAADVETEFQSVGYESRTKTDRASGSLDVKSTNASLQHRFGITVDGNLSEEELHDLDILFQKIEHIVRGFLQGRHDSAQAQSADLAEEFGRFTTLSALDLSVEAIRSVTVVAASYVTPGGALGAAAAIPQSSTGTTAPTPSSDSPDDTHSKIAAKDGQLASLLQQVLDALKEARVESEKVRTYLTDFLDKLHEDLVEALQDERSPKTDEPNGSGAPGAGERDALPNSHNVLVAYQTATETSLAFSLQV